MARTNPNAPVDPTDAPVTVGDADVDGDATATATVATVTVPKTVGTVMVQMPVKLKELIESKAKEANLNTAAYIRAELAKMVEYTLPLPEPRGRKSKYAGMSPNEAKAAKAKDSEARSKNIKALLIAARNGDIDLAAILAKYAADIEPKTKAPAADAAEAVTAGVAEPEAVPA